MAKKRRGLGNLGVDVLLSAAATPQTELESPQGTMKQLPVERIRRGRYQPRLSIKQEALEELAASIRTQGVVQPVVVRPIEEGYELIAGERRWRAAQLAGLDQIPAVVRVIPDQAAAAMTLIENIQREDLSPLEEANALKRLIDEFRLTHQEVAEAVGRSRTAVSNILRLLELGPDVKRFLELGELEMGHARALLALRDQAQVEAAHYVVAKSLSVRETERYIKTLLTQKRAIEPKKKDVDVNRLEQSLAEKLGAKVDILYNNKGKGRIIIKYNSLDELDGILSHIK